MQDFKKLKVWQQAHQGVLAIYQQTQAFPREEQYGLTSQLRRAAVSIPTNLAEGCGRRSKRDFSHFIQISIASCNEVEYLVLLCRDLGYLNSKAAKQVEAETISIRRQLVALQKTLSDS